MGAKKALDWYRELDMDYRSLKTGGQCEAIMNLAPRLLQWSLEPPVDQAAVDHLGLDPGQEQASANAIFSRIGDFFKSGSNVVRLCIVKVLVYVYRGHRKARASHMSLLSRERISGHAEVLSKVKSVATATDLTARCLGLRALGCLAQLDCDGAEWHRLVLMSMDSMHEQEAEAAYFAAGCFSENSASFAAICSRKLRSDLKASTTRDFAAIRLFSKMWLASGVASEMYEFGRDTMLKRPDLDVVKVTLTELSRLVEKAKLLLPPHIHLLLEYANTYPDASVQMLSLVFLRNLLHKAIYYLEPLKQEISPLLTVATDMSRSSATRSQALRALCKVASVYPLYCWSDLISVGEISSQDNERSICDNGLNLLVKIARKLESSKPTDNEVTTLLKKVTSRLCDRLCSPEDKPSVSYHLARRLITGSTKAFHIVVESLLERIGYIVANGEQEDDSGDIIMRNATDAEADTFKICALCHCLLICSTHFDSSYPDLNTLCQRISQVSESLVSSERYQKACMDLIPISLKASSVQGVVAPGYVREMAETMLHSSKFWPAYKLAKFLCIYGQWDIAENIFKSICDEVVSETCYFWLKALLQLCSAERLWSGTARETANRTLAETGSRSILLLESSLKSLDAAVRLDRSFHFEFQRRFIKLRIRLSKLIVDAVTLCRSVRQYQRLQGEEPIGKGLLLTCRGKAQPLVSDFQTLAGDFYVLSKCSIGIDNSSLQVLYAGMFESSLLGFCTAFAVLPGLGRSDNYKHSGIKISGYTYKTDVFEEVELYMHGDKTLQQFLGRLGRIALGDLRCRRDVPWSKTQPVAGAIRDAWRNVSELKPWEEKKWTLEKGIPFLNEVLHQLAGHKFLLPKFFFNTRPQVQLGLSLPSKQRETIAQKGSALTLSLALVLNHLPAGFRPRKLCCMLEISGARKHVSNVIYDGLSEEHFLLIWLAVRDRKVEDIATFVSTPLKDQHIQGFRACTLDVSNVSQGVHHLSSNFSVCTDGRGSCWIITGPRFTQKLKII